MPAKFISVANRKGGQMKSTLVILLSTAIRVRTQKRVLVIDADSQKSIMSYADRDGSVCDVLAFDWSLPNVRERLGKTVDNADANYDYVFFDLQGSTDAENTYLPLLLSDVIIIPFTGSQMAYDSTRSFIEMLPQATEGREVKVLGVLAMDDRTLEGREVKEAVKQLNIDVLQCTLSYRVRYKRDLSTKAQIVSSTDADDEFNKFYTEIKAKIDD